jgi:hypothetical protein
MAKNRVVTKYQLFDHKITFVKTKVFKDLILIPYLQLRHPKQCYPVNMCKALWQSRLHQQEKKRQMPRHHHVVEKWREVEWL